MTNPLRLYNPRDCSPADLEAMTVGREPILQDILADLKRQARDRVRQPWLLHAPRGFGKTHLLAMLSHRIDADPELRGVLVPIWLPESDAYVAFDLRSFLDQVLGQLAHKLQGDQAAVARIRSAIGSDPSAAGVALREECLVAEARTAGVTFVVLYENFDALAAVLDRSPASRDSKRLRAILTQSKYPVFVFTTAVIRFDAVDAPSRPMHQLFRSRHVAPLTEDDSAELYRRVRATMPQPVGGPSGRTVEADAWDRARIRTFHLLTGGSPRSIVIAIAAISAANGIDALVEELKSVLDANTPTFEQRLADLAPRERAIVSAMALAPTTLTLREIAAQSGLPERSLSTQVERLVDAGWIGGAYDNGGKGSLYEIRDGLFRIWFQYRRGDKILAPIVRFLALWFAPDELMTSIGRVQEQRGTSESSSLRHLRMAYELATQPGIQAERKSILAGGAPTDVGARDHSEPSADRATHRAGATSAILQSAVHAMNLARAHRHAGRLNDAIEAYHDALQKFRDGPEAAPREMVATALFFRGIALAETGRIDQAIASYDELLRRFGDAPEPTLRRRVADALIGRGLSLADAGQSVEAIKSFEQVSRRLSGAPEAELRAAVAWALHFRGHELESANRSDEALASFEELLRRFSDAPEAELRELVAKTLVHRGVKLRSVGRIDDAMASFDEVLRRFGDATDAALREHVAMALANRGFALRASNRLNEEIAAFEEVMRRFGTDPAAAFGFRTARVAIALVGAFARSGDASRCAGQLRDVASRMAALPSTDRPPTHDAIEQAMMRFPLADVRAWLTPFRESTDSDLKATAQLCDYVIDVVEAGEATGTGASGRRLITKNSRLVLARIPVEYRATAKEIAERVLSARQKLREGSSPPPVP